MLHQIWWLFDVDVRSLLRRQENDDAVHVNFDLTYNNYFNIVFVAITWKYKKIIMKSCKWDLKILFCFSYYYQRSKVLFNIFYCGWRLTTKDNDLNRILYIRGSQTFEAMEHSQIPFTLWNPIIKWLVKFKKCVRCFISLTSRHFPSTSCRTLFKNKKKSFSQNSLWKSLLCWFKNSFDHCFLYWKWNTIIMKQYNYCYTIVLTFFFSREIEKWQYSKFHFDELSSQIICFPILFERLHILQKVFQSDYCLTQHKSDRAGYKYLPPAGSTCFAAPFHQASVQVFKWIYIVFFFIKFNKIT